MLAISLIKVNVVVIADDVSFGGSCLRARESTFIREAWGGGQSLCLLPCPSASNLRMKSRWVWKAGLRPSRNSHWVWRAEIIASWNSHWVWRAELPSSRTYHWVWRAELGFPRNYSDSLPLGQETTISAVGVNCLVVSGVFSRLLLSVWRDLFMFILV